MDIHVEGVDPNAGNEFWGRLIAGLLTDLAIVFVILGLSFDIPALAIIGGAGFFLACSPALIAAPLMWVFGLYVAAQPFILLVEYSVAGKQSKQGRCVDCSTRLERYGGRRFCPTCNKYKYDG